MSPRAAWIVAALLLCPPLGCGGNSSEGGGSTGDYTAFSTPTPVAINGYTGDAMEPFLSKDGQYLFFNNRNDPAIHTDLHYALRVDNQTFTFQGPLQGANSPELDAVPSLDTLGHFYFVSTRSYTTTLSTIYSGQFAAGGEHRDR